jgi:hypothetical protein
MIPIDIDEKEPPRSRSTLRVLNGTDSDDAEVTELPWTLWNVTTGDRITIVSNEDWKRTERQEEVKVRKPSETAREGGQASDLAPFDDREEQITVPKKHRRGGSLDFLRRAVGSIGKYAAARAGIIVEPAVSTPAAPMPVVRWELPANAGALDTDFQLPAVGTVGLNDLDCGFQFPAAGTDDLDHSFQFPAAVPEQDRVVSMPTLSASATEEPRVHKRSGSFSRLLNVFGKKGKGEKKPKKSLRQSLNEHLDHSFKPESWKSVWVGEFQTRQLFVTIGWRSEQG